MTFTALLAQADARALETLGEEVTYTPGAGSAVTATGIFDAQYQRLEVGTAGVSSRGPAVFMLLSDLPGNPVTDEEATVTARGVVYSVKEAQPDGQGGIVLLLQES